MTLGAETKDRNCEKESQFAKLWRVRTLLPLLVLILLSILFVRDAREIHRLAQLDQISLDRIAAEQSNRVKTQLASALPVSLSDRPLETLADLARLLAHWLAIDTVNQRAAKSATDLANKVQLIDTQPLIPLQTALATGGRATHSVSVENWLSIRKSIRQLELLLVTPIDRPEVRTLIAELHLQLNSLRRPAYHRQLQSLFEQELSEPLLAQHASVYTVAGSNTVVGEIAADVYSSLQTRSAQRQRLHKRFLITALASLLLCVAWYLAARRQAKSATQVHELASAAEKRAIAHLEEEVAHIANGDLSRRVVTSNELTGQLSKSINHLVSHVRGLVQRTSETGRLFIHTIDRVRQSSQRVADGSVARARELHRASNYLSVLSDNTAQLSASAAEAHRLVEAAGVTAGVQSESENRENWAAWIERAGDESQQLARWLVSCRGIKVRLDSLAQSANRTNLHAINATIENSAGAAGEAQQEMIEEVARLAAEVKTVSQDIGFMVQAMLHGTEQSLHTTNEFSAVFTQCYQADLNEANSRKSWQSATGRLHDLMREIQEVAMRQSGVVRNLTSNLGIIDGLSEDAARQGDDNLAVLSRLDTLADEFCLDTQNYTLLAPGVGKSTDSQSGSNQPSDARKAATRAWSGDEIPLTDNNDKSHRKDSANKKIVLNG